jgi:hypothetical protein
METPQSPDQLRIILDAVGLDPKLTDMVTMFALAEFRRGYLHGQRDMKLWAESAIAGIRVEAS